MSLSLLEIQPSRGREHVLEDQAVIGRGPGCDVRLDDPLVSRRHARVLSSSIGSGIEDLSSTNGLYVNGRSSPGVTPLHPGDIVQLGGTVWQVLASRRQ